MTRPPDTHPTATAFAPWPFWRRWFGARSERAAARHLRGIGYRIVAANVADQRGELDLIALDGTTIVIVEVRSTSTADPALPAASVDAKKQRKLTDAAVRFLSRRRLLGANVRFDVIAIAWPSNQNLPTLVHYRDAFEAVGRFQMFQ